MLRDFLKNMAYACTEDEILAARIGLSAVLDFDHEMKEADCCAFSMKKVDFENPFGRMTHLFAWKFLEGVDKRKAERCEQITNLIALKHYAIKYKTEQFDGEIATLAKTIEGDPIPEVDTQVTAEALSADTATTNEWWVP